MKKQNLRGLASVTVLFLAFPVASSSEEISLSIKKAYPNLPSLDSIRESQIQGLWEVRIGSTVFYTDPKGKYIFLGELKEIASQRNFTQELVHESSKITFSRLPISDALLLQRGNGSKKLALFLDPLCPHCKSLLTELSKIDDTSVHIFLVGMLGPESKDVSTDLLCAVQPLAALDAWMSKSAKPKKNRCARRSLVQRNETLAKRHLINVVPTVVFPDGSKLEGAVDRSQLEAKWTASMTSQEAPSLTP